MEFRQQVCAAGEGYLLCVCCSMGSLGQGGKKRKVDGGDAGLASCFGILSTAFIF